MVVCAEELGALKRQNFQRRWRGGSSVTVSANALASQQLVEERAEKSESPVILEVKGLKAVVADTRQEILNGVDLVIRQGEVSWKSFFCQFSVRFFIELILHCHVKRIL